MFGKINENSDHKLHMLLRRYHIVPTMPLISKKTVVSVDLLCLKCRMKVMMCISKVEGITSIVLDPAKSSVTVIGEADPESIIKQVRKFRKTAQITSIGPLKDEKKMESIPSLARTCQKCDIWCTIGEEYYYSHCNSL